MNVLKIIEENGYYPYGLKHSGYNGDLAGHKAVANETKVEVREIPSDGSGTVETSLNQYKFNGQEYQSELALNLYDMDMRDYDPAIGRWLAIDPVTHFSQSPYNAFDGNPVFWADPSGADGISLMDLFNSAGNGITSYSSNGSGGFTQVGFRSEEDIIAGVNTGPGTLFATELEAAIDFAMNYNSYSIINRVEVVTTIYKLIKSEGEKYSYVTPVGCGGYCNTEQVEKSFRMASKIKGAIITASAHTHPGIEKKTLTKNQLRAIANDANEFSGDLSGKFTGDISTYNDPNNIFGKRINGYLSAPNGGLMFFDSTKQYTPKYVDGAPTYSYDNPVFEGLPSDPNLGQYRLNQINPIVNPSILIKW